MSLHRAGLMAITTLFTAGLTSAAFAGCCEGGVPAVSYSAGCGGCGAAVYDVPEAYATPVGYDSGVTLIAPSPIYVVNQGPHYSGPAIMTYKTYATGGYAGVYPYVYSLGTPYTGYDGGPYANPTNYAPGIYVGPGVATMPGARIVHRVGGPRVVAPRVQRHSGARYYYRGKVRG